MPEKELPGVSIRLIGSKDYTVFNKTFLQNVAVVVKPEEAEYLLNHTSGAFAEVVLK